MNKYRIGHIEDTWVNFTPPIRGGVFRENTEDVDSYTDASITDTEDDNDTDLSSYTPSWNSSQTSLDLDEDLKSLASNHILTATPDSLQKSPSFLTPPEEAFTPRCRRSFTRQQYKTPIAPSQPSNLTSPEIYTASILQEEINDGIRDNPSLDARTQRDIAVKYQALHQRVKEDGFYDCQYSEYGKEIIRYLMLFTLFLICLRAEWYMTSAVLLGLFWVGLSSYK